MGFVADTNTWHLPSSGTAEVSPAYSALWNQIGEADRAPLVLKAQESAGTPLTDKTITVPITTTQKILARQFVSRPLTSQLWSGNSTGGLASFTGVYRCTENNAGCNVTCCAVAYVCSQDGQTFRFTFHGGDGSVVRDTEWDITQTTRTFYNTNPQNGLVSQPGDRLVLEIGVQATAPSVAGTATIRFGNPSGVVDFAQTSGLTTDLCPYMNIRHDAFSNQSLKGGNIGTRPHPFQPGLTR